MTRLQAWSLILLFVVVAAGTEVAQVCVKCIPTENGEYRCETHAPVNSGGCPAGSQVHAEYVNGMDVDGWGRLNIKSLPPAAAAHGGDDDAATAYAAGYAEGVLTSDLMEPNFPNAFAMMFNNTGSGTDGKGEYHHDTMHLPGNVRRFLEEHWAYITDGAATATAGPGVWAQVALLRSQVLGLTAGYNSAVQPAGRVDLMQMLAWQLIGDMGSVKQSLLPHSQRRDYSRMTKEEAMRASMSATHCSAMVKLTPDYSELFMTHNTWNSYAAMLRVYKRYNLSFRHTAATTVVMPSYPGLLWSNDDFYMTSAGLAVQETTNEVFDMKLQDRISPRTLMTMWRVMAANRLATSGPQWVRLFSTEQSGTYTNQWMVVDYKLFTPGQAALPAHLLTIAEEFPGYLRTADVTGILQYSHWPSFNRPYFADGFALSGAAVMARKHGDWFTYNLSPRGQLFRRDAATKATTLEGVQAFMRYNDWKNDPVAEGNPQNAIACRSDLVPQDEERTWVLKDCEGAIDVKITSFALFNNDLSAVVIAGPTTDHGQPVFEWTAEWDTARWNGCMHRGQPKRFDFQWTTMTADVSGAARPTKPARSETII